MRSKSEWRRMVVSGAYLCAVLATMPVTAKAAVADAASADLVYRHGFIYTVDAKDSVQQALAVLDGRIVYVGNDAGIDAYIGKDTQVVDLHGRMMMPGLVDGHMHPLIGGASLLKCNLNYERLTVGQMQARIQACLDKTRDREPDSWLEVVNWFQEAMLPAGTVAARAVLDTLKTSRPIFVHSSFGHTGLVNSRAIKMAGIGKDTPDPPNGKIGRDSQGAPSGILDDAAQRLVDRLIPAAQPEDNVQAVKAALDAARKQGITSFLDAKANESILAAFAAVEHAGGLTARAHFALLIQPAEATQPQKVVTRLLDLRNRYDQGAVAAKPSMTVRNVKLFLDGVISAPALSGAMLEPYWLPVDGSANAAWRPSENRGPDVYFAAPLLKALLISVSRAGFEPHMHVDGDRAVHEGLDAVAALRHELPNRDIRVGMAHDEIVSPADFPRFRQLDVVPVLSFQWEKRAPDTVDNLEKYLGAARFKIVEPAGFLADAGARIAYGSDWPVDPLDEWFALKVGITRMNSPAAGEHYRARLGEDKGLTRQQALRAITMNSSYELHQDTETGSLERGKLADLIILDRNVLEIPAEQIAGTQVLQTVVGGKVVYSADEKGPSAAQAAAVVAPCGQNEICGLKNPEDVVPLDNKRWALVSRLGRDPAAPGGFSLVDLQARTAQVLTPDVSKPAIARYAKCPHAPAAADLVTHGLDIRRRADGTMEVFAVNHGGRESIEVFELDVGARGAKMTWTGCVMLPADVSANAVAALPDGLAVSSFGTSGDQGTAELLAGHPRGFVSRWTPTTGWIHLAGTEFGGDNGVVGAADGSVLYVNDWNDGTLRIVPLSRGAHPATIKLGDFHPDNVHMLANGNLLIAGQIGDARDILACASTATCPIGSMVVVVDPKQQAVRSRRTIAPTATFGAASTALSFGEDYWLSSFRGDRIMRSHGN